MSNLVMKIWGADLLEPCTPQIELKILEWVCAQFPSKIKLGTIASQSNLVVYTL